MQNNESYYDQTFTSIDHSYQSIENSEFEECVFEACDFSETVFRSCKFIECEFRNCNFSLAKVNNCRFFTLEFRDCKMVGIDWTLAHWPSFHADSELSFVRCILNDNSFFGLTLQQLKLQECRLHDVDFREGDFSHSSMTYCDFKQSQFMRTNLSHCDLTESSHFYLDLNNNLLAHAKLSKYEAIHLLESLDIELVD